VTGGLVFEKGSARLRDSVRSFTFCCGNGGFLVLGRPHKLHAVSSVAQDIAITMVSIPLQVDAVYENGVLRPLQPLDLREHERVIVSVVKATPASPRSHLDTKYIDRIKKQLPDAEDVPGLKEVRRRLAKIPGSMADEINAERGER
jgi:predicted DNA-binding antitoxin AbrB/MazE fold protein